MVFGQDGMLGGPINGTRRRKKQMLFHDRAHSLQEGQRPRDVIRVILQGVLYGFSHVGKSRKVHHIGDMVLLEDLHETASIMQISLDKVPPQRCLAMAINKIVINHRLIATLYQELDRVTTDI